MSRLQELLFTIGQSVSQFQDVLVIHMESQWSSFWLVNKQLHLRERTEVSCDLHQQAVVATGNRTHVFSGASAVAVHSFSPLVYGRISDEEILYEYLFQTLRKISTAAEISPWLFFPKIVVLSPAEFPNSQVEVWRRALLRLGLPTSTFVSFPIVWVQAMRQQRLSSTTLSLLTDVQSSYIELSLMQGKTLLFAQRMWYGTQQLFAQLADYCRAEHELDISSTVIETAFLENSAEQKKSALVWRGHHISSQQLQSVTITKKELLKAMRPFFQKVSQDVQTWLAGEIAYYQELSLEKMELWLRTSAFFPEEIADEMQKFFQQKVNYSPSEEFKAEFWKQYFLENQV